jgi:DNA-binding GntR family transcriptional regulator
MKTVDFTNVAEHEFGSVREEAYQKLKLRLMTLDLPPESAVDIAQLMRELEVGRTPLIEAIQRLAREDLLTIHPRRGTVVTQPSFIQARYVFEVRDIFEGRAARLATKRTTEEALDELRQLVAEQKRGAELQDFKNFLLLDYRLHLEVAMLSGNPLLARTLDHLLTLNTRLWFAFFNLQGMQTNRMYSHEPILNAIERRDPDAAEAAAVAHVLEAKEGLFAMF